MNGPSADGGTNRSSRVHDGGTSPSNEPRAAQELEDRCAHPLAPAAPRVSPASARGDVLISGRGVPRRREGVVHASCAATVSGTQFC